MPVAVDTAADDRATGDADQSVAFRRAQWLVADVVEHGGEGRRRGRCGVAEAVGPSGRYRSCIG